MSSEAIYLEQDENIKKIVDSIKSKGASFEIKKGDEAYYINFLSKKARGDVRYEQGKNTVLINGTVLGEYGKTVSLNLDPILPVEVSILFDELKNPGRVANFSFKLGEKDYNKLKDVISFIKGGR